MVNGYFHGISYKPTTTLGPNFPNGYTVTVTADVSGASLLTLATPTTVAWSYYPRVAVCSSSGGPIYSGPTSSGSGVAIDRVPLVNDRVKIVIAAGGSSHFGTFYAYVGG